MPDEVLHEAESICARVRGTSDVPVTIDDSTASELLRLFGAPDSVPAIDSSVGTACRIELIVDDLFGPVVAFGLAGPIPELLGDRAYAAPPLTDVDARALVAAPVAAALLTDDAGAPVDRDGLSRLVLAVSTMSEALPDAVAANLHVMAHPAGVELVSASLTIGSPSQAADESRRVM